MPKGKSKRKIKKETVLYSKNDNAEKYETIGEVKKKITELESKGTIEQAIVELKKAIQGCPKEGSLFNKLGDLYLKVNRQKEALDAYEKGVVAFKDEEYHLNAMALCKKILKIDPKRTAMRNIMDGLYIELGLSDKTLEEVEPLPKIKEKKLAAFKKKFFKFLYDGFTNAKGLSTILSDFESSLTDDILRQVIKEMITKINKGLSLSTALARTKLFNEFEINMIDTGEKSGTLDIMLAYLLSLYKRKSLPSDLEKFSHVMAVSLSSGMPIYDAVELGANCVVNKKFKKHILYLRKNFNKKRGVFEKLNPTYFPRWSRIYIKLGEMSGGLDECFWKVVKQEEQIAEKKSKPPTDKYLFDFALKHLKNYGLPHPVALRLMMNLEFNKKYKDIMRKLFLK